MSETHGNTVVVIGAGIVGISTAIWLLRAGKNVIVVDKGEPGMGASYGNAGLIAACGVAPVTGPGLIRKSPKMLLDPNFPLFMRWSYLPKMLPWLIRFLSNANEKDTRRIARGLAPIVCDSVEQHRSLAQGTTAEGWLTDCDYALGYADRSGLDADTLTMALRAEVGFTPEVFTGAEVREYDPNIGISVDCLAVMKNHAYVRAPGRYVQALADVFRAEGGTINQAEVMDFDIDLGRVKAVITDQGRIPCAQAVLTTGAWSKPLTKKLGLSVPLETERGYHIMFKDPSFTLRSPTLVTDGKFIATPMEDGLRCAGIVEFGGLEAGPSKAPLDLMRKHVMKTFPTLEYSGTEEWMGFRPSFPDSLPLIGEINGTGVFAGFGHQHIGLTGGAKTGRMIADLIAQGGSNLDLTAYDPARF